MILKGLKQWDLLEQKFITMNLCKKVCLNETDKLKESTMPKTYVKKIKKTLTFENVNTVLKERQNFPPGFESGVFLIKITDTRKRTYFRLSLPSQGLWP